MSLLNDMLNDLNSKKPKRSDILLTSSFRQHWFKQSANVFCWLLIIGIAIFFIYVLMYGKHPADALESAINSSGASEPRVADTASKPKTETEILISSIPPAPLFVGDENMEQEEEYADFDTNLSEIDEQAFIEKKKIKLSPEEWHDEKLNAALEALEAGAEQRATDLLTLILTRFPVSIEARENLAAIYLSQRALDEAYTVLNDGLSYEPHNLSLATMKARVLIEQGHHHEALTLLEQFNPDITKSPEYYALLAALFETLGRTNEAGSLYQALIRLDPTNGQYWLGLGIALEHKHALQQAMEAYKRATQSDNIQPAVRSYAENRLNSLQG